VEYDHESRGPHRNRCYEVLNPLEGCVRDVEALEPLLKFNDDDSSVPDGPVALLGDDPPTGALLPWPGSMTTCAMGAP
jgi:hypothetical protein